MCFGVPVCLCFVIELKVFRFTVLPLVQANGRGFKVFSLLQVPFAVWLTVQLIQSVTQYMDVVTGALFVARTWKTQEVCQGGEAEGNPWMAWMTTAVWVLGITRFLFALRRTWPSEGTLWGRPRAVTRDIEEQKYRLRF